MDQTLAESLRISMMLGLMCLAVQAVPELSNAAARPFLVLWTRLRLFKASLADRFRPANKRAFWEIDMTQFEP